MDYLKFYKLNLEPFRNDPDERFYFESAGARKAYLRVLRGVHQHKGLGVLIGPPGCGKTTLGEHLHRGLDGHQWAPRCLSIGHADCSSGWLLPHVAQVFEVGDPAADAPRLLEQIHARFIELQGEGRYPVLIVDEAQLLGSSGVMQEFRGLLNLMHEGRKTVSVVLLGLHALADVLALDEPLAQRVEVRVEIAALDRDEVGSYLDHRLTVAGSSNLFTDDAVDAFWSYSGGVPRLINTLADNVLFESFLAEEPQPDAAMVAEAAQQLGLKPASHAGGVSGPKDGTEGRPDWMESLVPPAETDFGLGEVAGDAIAEEEPELEDAMNSESGTQSKLAEGEFSMGSIVRALEGEDGEDEEDGEADLVSALASDEDTAVGAELALDLASDDGEVELDLGGEGDDAADTDSGQFELDLEADDLPPAAVPSPPAAARVEPAGEVELDLSDDEDEFELEIEDDSDDALEIEMADVSAADPLAEEPGMDTKLSLGAPGEEVDLELDEPETSEVPIPTLNGDEDVEFDPASLLDCDEDGEFELELKSEAEAPETVSVEDFDPASMLDDEPEEPKAPVTTSADDEEDDLDALFDEIQLPD
jgi:type II secretory pathway predicted ATPase ExeA